MQVFIQPMSRSLPNGFVEGLAALTVLLTIAFCLFVKMGSYCEKSPCHALKLIKAMLGAVLFVHISLLSDGEAAPRFEIFVSVVCHCVYSLQLISFPHVRVGSVKSMTCFGAFVVSHLIWLHHFRDHTGEDLVTLVVFYFVMVYLVPFTLAATVEISDFELPTLYTHKATSPIGNLTPIKSSNNSNFLTPSHVDNDQCSPRIGLSYLSMPRGYGDKYK